MAATFPLGIDFRNSKAGPAGFVGDPSGYVYEISHFVADYTSAQGWGYESAPSACTPIDRTGTVDPRLAGSIKVPNSGTQSFRIDLPAAGTYLINLGAGDASFAFVQSIAIQDNTTTIATVCSAQATAAGSFVDATGVNRTAAAWPGSNAALSLTFSSTIMRLVFGGAGTSDTTFATVLVSQSGGTSFTTDTGVLVRRLSRMQIDSVPETRHLASAYADSVPRAQHLASLTGDVVSASRRQTLMFSDRLGRSSRAAGSAVDVRLALRSLAASHDDATFPTKALAKSVADGLGAVRRATVAVPTDITLKLLRAIVLAPSFAGLGTVRLSASRADVNTDLVWLSHAIVIMHDAYGHVRWGTVLPVHNPAPGRWLSNLRNDVRLAAIRLTVTANADRLVHIAHQIDVGADEIIHVRRALGLDADGALVSRHLVRENVDLTLPLRWSTTGAIIGASHADAEMALSWLTTVIADGQAEINYDAVYVPVWLRGISRIMFVLGLTPLPITPPSPPFDWSS